MIKAIKFIFWTCIFAGLALTVRVTSTVNGNGIETRHYENGDILKWEANGERMRYKYIWHVPMIGRITWHWSVIGSETTGVPLREL